MNMQEMSAAMRSGAEIAPRQRFRTVIALSLPAILEQLVATMMSYIDTAMVGTLGPDATAAIGVVSSTVWLFNGIISAVAVGFSVQVAQYLGAGREADSRSVLSQSILFNGVFGLAIAAAAILLGQVLPAMLGADPALQAPARTYFCTVGAFLPFNLAAMLYSSILRCSGNIRLPSLMNIAMCLLDVVFNFFLIYPTREIGGITVWGAGLGVWGAALGTGLAMLCVGVTLLAVVALRQGPLCLRGHRHWRFTQVCLHNTLRLATPAALERVTLNLAQILMTAVVAGMGTTAVAANYVGVQAESICYLPAYGIAAAATALVGQSVGAGRPDMARWFAMGTTLLSAAVVAAASVLLFFTAPMLAGTMTDDPQVLELSVRVLRIVVFSEPLFAVSISAIGALRGAGDSKGPFLLNLCSMWGIRVLAVLLFARPFGLVGVWAAMSAELVFRGILFWVRLRRGKWLEHQALA